METRETPFTLLHTKGIGVHATRKIEGRTFEESEEAHELYEQLSVIPAERYDRYGSPRSDTLSFYTGLFYVVMHYSGIPAEEGAWLATCDSLKQAQTCVKRYATAKPELRKIA